MLICELFFIQESSSRSIRGADGQAAAKSSLADIEKRKKGMQQSSRKCTDNLLHKKKKMFQKKKVSWRMKSKIIMLQYMRVKHQKNLMHTFLSQF